ncbi:MAG: MarR family transcriptional regulator [Firmicutes bacterium]|nr:MarR family transcriptional regulator [Bacillota bacterium]
MKKSKMDRYISQLENLFPDIIEGMSFKVVQELAELKITLAQFQALSLLAEKKGCIMSELAKGMSQSFSTTTGIVDRLIRDGLARRERDKKDRRVVRVFITSKGKYTVGQFKRYRKEHLISILESLKEKDRKTLIQAMGILSQAIKRQRKR